MSNTEYTSKSIPLAGSAASGVTATQLPPRESYRGLRELLVQAHPANTDNILIGNQTAQAIVLEAGDSFVIALEDPGEVWHRAATGTQTLNYLGRD